jgi:hypothetical protein
MLQYGKKRMSNSFQLENCLFVQVEGLVELWRPAVGLGLGGLLALLVGEVRANQVRFHERPEHALLDHPLEVVRGHD